jgi:retron-type reverse transcriptase
LLERSFDVLSDHFNEQRIADRRIVRLIQKWLKAEVSEDGRRICSEVGTVQGDGIRPLLANKSLNHLCGRYTFRPIKVGFS